jgi:hypothetical protein
MAQQLLRDPRVRTRTHEERRGTVKQVVQPHA